MIALLSILFAAYASIVLWLLRGTIRTPRPMQSSPRPSISVIVAARDEGLHLQACLDALARQEYTGEWEVWIVDDRSHDNTLSIARGAATGRPSWHVAVNEHPGTWRSGKKGALATAIKSAKGEVLLFTDADCTPPPLWMAGMAAMLPPQTGLCAGFSPLIAPEAPRLWQNFLLIDTLVAALVAAGSIGNNRGITCTGRSLACRRAALVEIGGYAALPDTLSGDDDFLLQAVARRKNWRVSYALSAQTAVPALGPPGWRAFLRQKKRHLSAGTRYSSLARAGYFVFHVANGLIWSAGLIGLFVNPAWALLLLLKIILDSLVLSFWSIRLSQPFSPIAFLTWEAAFPLYHLAAFPRSGKEIPWKQI